MSEAAARGGPTAGPPDTTQAIAFRDACTRAMRQHERGILTWHELTSKLVELAAEQL